MDLMDCSLLYIFLSYGHMMFGPVQISFRILSQTHCSSHCIVTHPNPLLHLSDPSSVKSSFYPASRWLSLTGPWLPASAIHCVSRFTELPAPPFPAIHAVCVAPGMPCSPYQAIEGLDALGLVTFCSWSKQIKARIYPLKLSNLYWNGWYCRSDSGL